MKMHPLRAAVLAALLPVFVAGCSASSVAAQPAPAPAATASAAARGPGFDFTQLAKEEGPAVVNISVTKEVAAQMPQLDPHDPFYPFFRRFQDGVPRHCGLCSKCRERHDAFLVAGVPDPTEYADTRFVRT